MKSPRIRVAVLLVLGFCCAASILISLVNEGFRPTIPASKMREAQQAWQEGEVSKSISSTYAAITMAIDAGIRWSLARIYAAQMIASERSVNFPDALKYCTMAVEIIDGYDDEGVLSTHCYLIKEELYKRRFPK